MKLVNDKFKTIETHKPFDLEKGNYLALGDRLSNLEEVVEIQYKGGFTEKDIKLLDITLEQRGVRIRFL